MSQYVALGIVSIGLLFASIGHAESYRCQSRLISEGDTALELKARCGEPDYVTVRNRLVATGFVGPQATTLIPSSRVRGAVVAVSRPPVRIVRYTNEQVQSWLYEGDGTAFPRLISIRRGKVASIQSLGPLDLSADPKCVRGRFSQGDSDVVVEIACGEPDDRSVWEEDLEVQVGGFLERRRIQRERWVYHPGPGRLLRLIEFADGKLTSIKTGGRAP